jgi:hypothetical protein
MAKEALALHIEGLLDDNESIPSPTAAEEIDRDDALLVAAIEVPDNLKVERINVTIPALALQRFDAFAQRHSMTRSGLLVEAAHRWIAQEAVRAPPSLWRSSHTHFFEGDAEQTPMISDSDATEAALNAIRAALAHPEHASEQPSKNVTSEKVARHIIWLTRELEKAVQTLIERGASAQPPRKERA